MHRRNFFAVAAGALVTSCVPEIAPAKPMLRCPMCFAPAHFHRIWDYPQYSPLVDGRSPRTHTIEHWMTPRGEVWVKRWPDMDHGHLMRAVETEMFFRYPR